jgi:cysteine desulfurase
VSGFTYLDHAASTPTRPEAIAAMLPLLTESYGNPSGAHALARAARRAIDDARDQMALALGCEPGDVVFTGSGTEADNLAIFGVLGVGGGRGVCPAGEHHAVLHPVEHVGGTVVALTTTGVVDLDALAAALGPDVRLVSVMLANNETGMITDLAAVAAVVAEHAPHALLHTDAVQAMPWLDVATLAAPAQLISVSAHKFGGPKGVGALAVRAGVELAPHVLGGGQERGRRSGTHNAGGIVAMGVAAALTVVERDETVGRVRGLRDRLVDGLLASVPGTVETGDRAAKVAGSCHVCFSGVESEALLFLLEREGICASAASSCASGAQDPSHVLAAMGYERALAAGSLRLSLGATTTAADVEHALAVIPPAVARLRERS